VAGVVLADGTLYAAVNGGSGGVYEYELGSGDDPSELATLLPDGDGFVNDLYTDGDRLLVTESFGGAVYEVPTGAGTPTTWVQDDLLDTDSFGANGITRIDDDVYVAITRASDGDDDVGRVVRVPVATDGSAGTPATYVEDASLFGADGLTARGPQLYAAVNSGTRVTRVTPSGQLRTVVETELIGSRGTHRRGAGADTPDLSAPRLPSVRRWVRRGRAPGTRTTVGVRPAANRREATGTLRKTAKRPPSVERRTGTAAVLAECPRRGYWVHRVSAPGGLHRRVRRSGRTRFVQEIIRKSGYTTRSNHRQSRGRLVKRAPSATITGRDRRPCAGHGNYVLTNRRAVDARMSDEQIGTEPRTGGRTAAGAGRAEPVPDAGSDRAIDEPEAAASPECAAVGEGHATGVGRRHLADATPGAIVGGRSDESDRTRCSRERGTATNAGERSTTRPGSVRGPVLVGTDEPAAAAVRSGSARWPP
jgi:hypothetical protein